MKNELRAKLTKRLTNAFSDRRPFDPDSLKAGLIDTRDLLELLGESSRYKALKFHCDWTLHTALTGPRAQRIIKAVDGECVKTMEIRGLQEWPENVGHDFFAPLSTEFVAAVLSRLTFMDFESDLREFLGRHGIARLPHPVTPPWRNLELAYCELIRDRTWDYTNKKDPTRWVNRVQVRMRDRRMDGSLPAKDQSFPFFLAWAFLWNDESRLIFEAEFLTEREACK
jgi:hypothetical protein